jgi:hypothetical protein
MDCPDFDMIRGTFFGAWLAFEKNGEPTFHVEHQDGCEIVCGLEWFKEFFELVE